MIGMETYAATGTDTRTETASLPEEDTAPRVGVVIIGRNEAAHLGDCIASVRAMRYPAERVDVLYVDSDSQDGSAELAEAAGVRVLCLEGSPMTAGERSMRR
jgi:cellulose synthase/poly-beta-1,6-N-acetylglucosamine synthase-like glycosyltransferase